MSKDPRWLGLSLVFGIGIVVRSLTAPRPPLRSRPSWARADPATNATAATIAESASQHLRIMIAPPDLCFGQPGRRPARALSRPGSAVSTRPDERQWTMAARTMARRTIAVETFALPGRADAIEERTSAGLGRARKRGRARAPDRRPGGRSSAL